MAMHKPLYLFILFGFFLAGCAAGGERPQTLEQKLAVKKLIVGDPVRAIRNYRMSGWSYLDSRHLVIDSGVKDRYLVSLRHDCDELRSAFDIGFKTYTGSLTDTDSVVVRAPGGFTMNCPIDSLHELVRVQTPAEEQ